MYRLRGLVDRASAWRVEGRGFDPRPRHTKIRYKMVLVVPTSALMGKTGKDWCKADNAPLTPLTKES